MLERQALRDHPAERCADHVGAVELEMIEQRRGVVGHVGEAVRDLQRLPGGAARDELGQRRHGHAVEACGQADVAVVVADHEVPAAREAEHELVVPGQELAAQAHDQQDGRIGGVARDLILDLDAVAACTRHGPA